MINLIRILTYIFIIFTFICIFFCFEAYFRYRQKTGIDKDDNYTSEYQYFGQKLYDEDNQTIGYELLMREFDPEIKKWRLPKNVENFPLNLAADEINKLQDKLDDSIKYLSINMTVYQLLDFRAENFLNWVMGMAMDKTIIIELDVNDLLNTRGIKYIYLCSILEKLASDPHVKVAIEDVDSSKREYRKLNRFLPWIDYVKFNANAFNKSKTHWIDITLAQWQRKLEKYSVTGVLGKVESESQDELADQLNVPMREGYLYERPDLIEK
ncbi:MAG: EAL domain-containing protein [Lactobacillus sp.]